MNNYLNPMLLCDFYKISHRNMFPDGMQVCYSTWTPRATRMKDVNEVVVFGAQAFIQNYLVDFFNDNFFKVPVKTITKNYKDTLASTLGVVDADTSHIEALHSLGHLPLLIKALPEGSIVPLRVPYLTIQNTDPRFFWLTNYIETLASCELWQASTSATIAHEYRKLLDKWALTTVGNTDFVPFQGHDFSMRGMSSLQSAVSSGMGHLTSFVGTDTIPAIQSAEHYYSATGLVGTSIPATEHSIQCAYGDDYKYLKRMITEVHPKGFVSVVSDGYDFWDVLTNVVPSLKEEILARDGKVVIRPDSGDPVKIVCGDPDAPVGSPEFKGAVEVLWETFGGSWVGGKSGTEYKLLDSHIGLIYGDAITLKRAEEICERLERKGFASINCVYGIGSFSYQYNTRDTFGFALKSTACVINGEEMQIFKSPKTDDGIKKSLKGRVAVLKDGSQYKVIDGLSLTDTIKDDQLKEVFLNGNLLVEHTFSEIRNRLREHA